MAQCTMPFSVGGSTLENSTTNSVNSDQISTELSKSNDNQQINGCNDDPPIEEVVVYGHVTSFSWGPLFWWSPSPGGNGGGSGSGNGSTTFGDVDANKECMALGADKRMDLATLAFIAARAIAIRTISGRINFASQYHHGSTFELTLPNGSVIRMNVSAWNSSKPLTAERSNSCG